MVAVNSPMTTQAGGSSLGEGTDEGKCRYKTGKCSNTRSSKRNGQLHQLCLFHREKANRIQRKFDRQKRQLARSKSGTKKCSPRNSASLSSSFHTQQPINDPDFYSDSDASRLSTDSESGGFSWDDLWADIPTLQQGDNYEEPIVNATNAPPSERSSSEERLSVDELDFLCSAILA